MRFISTRAHGIIDYVVSILLIVSPWLFGFAGAIAAKQVALYMGIFLLVVALGSNYELGLVKLFSLRANLWLDFLSGLFLIASPWLFHFNDLVYFPHVLIGLVEVSALFFTRKVVGSGRAVTHTEKSGSF